MSGRQIVDIKKESCRMYEGHFLPLSRLPCHRARHCFAVVSQSVWFFFVFFFCFSSIQHTFTCIFLSMGSLLFLYPCASLSGAASVRFLCSQTDSTVLTAVFVTGSTWHLTASPRACCWWRKCPGTRWARSTRRTCCSVSFHDRTVFI